MTTLQLVHNDFRAANVLTRDSEIVGVLDFDDVVLATFRMSDSAIRMTVKQKPVILLNRAVSDEPM